MQEHKKLLEAKMRSFSKFFNETIKYGYKDARLTEELNDYQKSIVDSWNSGPSGTISRKSGRVSDNIFPPDQHRVTIPLEASGEAVQPHPDVANHLQSNGYKIKDYTAGLAEDPNYPKRSLRIGSLLQKTGATPDVVNAFQNDPARAASKASTGGLQIVLSRHPHDIAGASTDRGWNSCMRMPEDEDDEGGMFNHYLQHDVEQGSVAAYLTKAGDHEAKHPLSRIMLKPWENVDDTQIKGDKTILRPEEKGYGTADNSFSHTVRKWAETHYPGGNAAYRKNPYVYNDAPKGAPSVIFGADANPIDYINHPKQAVRAAVSRHPNLIPEDINALFKNLDSEHVRKDLVNHPNFSRENISTALSDPSSLVRAEAMKHPDITPAHIEQAMKDPDSRMRVAAAQHPKATPEQLDRMMNDSYHYVRHVALTNPNIKDRHVIAGLHDPYPYIKENAQALAAERGINLKKVIRQNQKGKTLDRFKEDKLKETNDRDLAYDNMANKNYGRSITD